ncbi:MAG: hypothetical protein KGZ85_06220 [Ignavibacterium sp.]|nr:hypothetical protein [Ignavibacterium sp.]
MNKDLFKLDKNSFAVTSIAKNENDVGYWLSKTPEERVLAIEFLRQMMFGYDPLTERLQRVFETAEFKAS